MDEYKEIIRSHQEQIRNWREEAVNLKQEADRCRGEADSNAILGTPERELGNRDRGLLEQGKLLGLLN